MVLVLALFRIPPQHQGRREGESPVWSHLFEVISVGKMCDLGDTGTFRGQMEWAGLDWKWDPFLPQHGHFPRRQLCFKSLSFVSSSSQTSLLSGALFYPCIGKREQHQLGTLWESPWGWHRQGWSVSDVISVLEPVFPPRGVREDLSCSWVSNSLSLLTLPGQMAIYITPPPTPNKPPPPVPSFFLPACFLHSLFLRKSIFFWNIFSTRNYLFIDISWAFLQGDLLFTKLDI